MSRPRFQLLDPRQRVQGSVGLTSGELILGREVVGELGGGADPSVSRRHARVWEEGGTLWIEDLGSRNGTLVNGVRVEEPLRLSPGDVIEVGEQRFRLAGADVVEELAPRGLYEAVTLAATRPGSSERLSLILELSRMAGGRLSFDEAAQALQRILDRTLHPKALVIWGRDVDRPVAGEADRSPLAPSLVRERVVDGGNALRVPGGNEPATALALPICPDPHPTGVLVLGASEERPFSEEDLYFAFAAVALASEALRGAARLKTLRMAAGDGEIVGGSPELERAVREADLVAPYADLSVLLVGETGTGKELFARRIHERSGRSGPFVAVNVAALPADLLESELFGHTKGAFTGATTAKTGYVEHASGGTLFLDEIGEMAPLLQAKLLRVLQEQKLQRVGDPRPLDVDLRLVAATNANLREKIGEGAFREDLYYRIAAKEVRIPPLRDRVGDVALLARHFLERSRGRTPHPVSAIREDALALLERCPWPGNVRQLEGTIRLAVIHAAAERADEVRPEHLDDRIATPAVAAASSSDFPQRLAQAERAVVLEALRAAQGNKRGAARLLGWSVNTLRDRLERYAIGDEEYR